MCHLINSGLGVVVQIESLYIRARANYCVGGYFTCCRKLKNVIRGFRIDEQLIFNRKSARWCLIDDRFITPKLLRFVPNDANRCHGQVSSFSGFISVAHPSPCTH